MTPDGTPQPPSVVRQATPKAGRSSLCSGHGCAIKKARGCWVSETISGGDARATSSHDWWRARIRPHVTAARFLFTRSVKHAARGRKWPVSSWRWYDCPGDCKAHPESTEKQIDTFGATVGSLESPRGPAQDNAAGQTGSFSALLACHSDRCQAGRWTTLACLRYASWQGVQHGRHRQAADCGWPRPAGLTKSRPSMGGFFGSSEASYQ